MASTQSNKIQVLAACHVTSGCLSSSSTISYYWRLLLPPGHSFSSGYLLLRMNLSLPPSIVLFTHSVLKLCRETYQLSFLALLLSGARSTTHLGPRGTADSVSPVLIRGSSPLHSFYLYRRLLFSLMLFSPLVSQVSS